MSAKRTRSGGALRSSEKKKPTEGHPTMNVSEFFEREDREALSMTMSSIEESFLEHSRILRQKITDLSSGTVKPAEVASLGESVLSRFISLRRLNRLAQFRNRKLRDQVNRERGVVEERFLQLQNVNSEIEHLQKEIDRCNNFRSADEDIELVPLEEFYANAPASISQEEITRKDPHRLHLARLNWEMEERKNLVGTLQERDGRKNVLISDITTKEHRLKSLKPRIEAIIEAARPVQELMGLSSGPVDSEKERVLSLLPQELSVTAVQVEAYCDIAEESGILLKCKGDYESAVKFLESQQHATEIIEDSDDDESQDVNGKHSPPESSHHVKRRRVSMKEMIAERREAAVAPHPIHIEMEITCQDDVCVTLKLQYVPGLRSVGVITKVNRIPTSVYGPALFDESLLSELFDGDDGSKCANSAGQAKLDQLGISVAGLESKIGRLYGFAQKMAGLTEDASKNLQLCEIIHSVVRKIRSRVRSRCALARITHSLRALKVFDELKNRDDFPVNVCAKLTDFRMITAEQFFENPLLTDEYRKLIECERTTSIDKQFFFSSTVERNPGAKLQALIYIDIKYPKTAPIYILGLTLNNMKFTSASNSSLNHLEQVLNTDFASYVKCEESNSILEAQMAFLVSRFDILLETHSVDANPGQFNREHLFTRSHRGRDHQLPLCYRKNINAFTFRT